MKGEDASATDDEIVRTVTLKASIDKVWSAISDPQQFGTWFRCTVEGEFNPGTIVNCASTYEGHEEMVWQKLIKAVEPKRYFAFSWSPGDTGADQLEPDGEQTLVEFFLQETNEGTVLKIRESGFAALSEELRNRSFELNSSGWDAQVENITQHVQ
ncbi:MAG: SRPBCC family protein [Pseudomonadales bacterium]